MAKYRKKPIIVGARQWLSLIDSPNPCVLAYKREKSEEEECDECGGDKDTHGWIKTKEGGHIVCPFDWIITGIKGEHYPCKPDIFEQTYEKVD